MSTKYNPINETIPLIDKWLAEGMTRKDIASRLGVSRQRVCQIIGIANREKNRVPHWTDGLSRRNKTVIESLKLADRGDVLRAINDTRIPPWGGFKNYGIKSYHDLCAWMGVAPVPYRSK